MAKKIRFPLDMGNGIEVRTLEELQKNFSVEKVLGYYVDGKLIIWLRDRYLDDIVDAISELDKNDSDFVKKICNAFGVDYNEEVDIEILEEKNRKLSLLKQYTDKKEYFDVVDDIAFNQDELYDLLDEDKNIIYLCGDKFSIPLSKRGICYIGVNMPEVIISSKEKINFEERGIKLQKVKFDRVYENVAKQTNFSTTEKMYVDGKVSESFKIFKNEAENGNPRAMYYLGEIYSRGYGGIKVDNNLAFQWRKRGYEKGDILASINYAFMLDDEERKTEIVRRSIKGIESISDENPVAKFELADLYKSAKYVVEDYSKYISLNEESANAGFWLAMNKLANAYYSGKYVCQDYKKAVFWYKKSAEMGYDWAYYNLAKCYCEGKGIVRDVIEGGELFEKAIEQGNPDILCDSAIYCFNNMVNKGVLVEWLGRAAEQGHQKSIQELKNIANTWMGAGARKKLEELGFDFNRS